MAEPPQPPETLDIRPLPAGVVEVGPAAAVLPPTPVVTLTLAQAAELYNAHLRLQAQRADALPHLPMRMENYPAHQAAFYGALEHVHEQLRLAGWRELADGWYPPLEQQVMRGDPGNPLAPELTASTPTNPPVGTDVRAQPA